MIIILLYRKKKHKTAGLVGIKITGLCQIHWPRACSPAFILSHVGPTYVVIMKNCKISKLQLKDKQTHYKQV